MASIEAIEQLIVWFAYTRLLNGFEPGCEILMKENTGDYTRELKHAVWGYFAGKIKTYSRQIEQIGEKSLNIKMDLKQLIQN